MWRPLHRAAAYALKYKATARRGASATLSPFCSESTLFAFVSWVKVLVSKKSRLSLLRHGSALRSTFAIADHFKASNELQPSGHVCAAHCERDVCHTSPQTQSLSQVKD
jgi:hypothetical protein